MYAVLFRVPNDNFKDLHAKTFEVEDEMHDWITNADDFEICGTTVANNSKELEEVMIERLDYTNPLWEMDGINYWME